MERIDKFIADRTELSRKEVRNVLKKGEVKVNEEIITDPSYKTDPDSDIILFRQRELVYRKNTYIMLNKPDGIVCSTKDGISQTVMSLVPDHLHISGLFPAGRLDKDSKGFVFLTDDGELAHRMLSPKKHIAKYYLVKLKKDYDPAYQDIFAFGMEIDGGEICLPAKVQGFSEDRRFAFVELFEGKYHQIKRMFSAVGNEVEVLFRTRIGNLEIDNRLLPGECLELLNNDIAKMLSKIDFTEAYSYTQKSFWSYLINNNL